MGAWIRKRRRKDGGYSFQVIYRRGRYHKAGVSGSFDARKYAKKRLDLVQNWLALGLDPAAELERLLKPPPPRRTFDEAGQMWLESRRNVAELTRRAYAHHLKAFSFGSRPVETITPDDVSAWVAGCGLSPATVKAYIGTARMIFDHADVEPNPARSPKVELPRMEREEVNPPPAVHLETILERVGKRLRLPLVTAEQAALRVSEVQNLEWQNVDEQGCRLRVSKAKGGKTRWAPLPEWLMDVISQTCPREDRTPDRRVFQGFNDGTARKAMERACRDAGILHYSPHDLRHRRISIWHGQGVPIANIAQRVGHSRSSMTLDTYSHVMPLDELPVARYLALLGVEPSPGGGAEVAPGRELAAIGAVEPAS